MKVSSDWLVDHGGDIRIAAVVIAMSCLSLVACGGLSRSWTGWTGGLTEKCARTGVIYVQSDSGLALLVDKAGKPVECAP